MSLILPPVVFVIFKELVASLPHIASSLSLFHSRTIIVSWLRAARPNLCHYDKPLWPCILVGGKKAVGRDGAKKRPAAASSNPARKRPAIAQAPAHADAARHCLLPRLKEKLMKL